MKKNRSRGGRCEASDGALILMKCKFAQLNAGHVESRRLIPLCLDISCHLGDKNGLQQKAPPKRGFTLSAPSDDRRPSWRQRPAFVA